MHPKEHIFAVLIAVMLAAVMFSMGYTSQQAISSSFTAPAPSIINETTVMVITPPEEQTLHEAQNQPTATPTFSPTPSPTPSPTSSPTPSPTSTPTPPPIPSPTPSPVPTPVIAENRPLPQTLRLPILMYHYVGDLPREADTIRRDLTVSTVNFETQVDFLARSGYETLSLADLVAAFNGLYDLPPKPVILTFDDGYEDNYTDAYPVLQTYDAAATFFIVTSYIGSPGYMTWDDLREMDEGGMSIEAHGRTHADFSLLSAEAVNRQLLDASQAIENNIGKPPRFFAYPSGKHNATVINALRNNGFEAAVTTRHGLEQFAQALFELRRIRIRGSDTLTSFARKLEGISAAP